MPHLAGVLDDGTHDCGINLVEMMGLFSCSLEQDNEIQALSSFCGDFIDVYLPRKII